MKIVVISDIHYPGRCTNLDFLELIKKEKPNLIIGCGDYTNPEIIEKLKNISEFKGVSGNCDFYGLPEELLLSIESHKIFVIHSHQFGRGNINELYSYAKVKYNPNIILFGHIHKPYLEYKDGIYILNPGSISGVISGSKEVVPKSYLVIYLSKNNLSFSFRFI